MPVSCPPGRATELTRPMATGSAPTRPSPVNARGEGRGIMLSTGGIFRHPSTRRNVSDYHLPMPDHDPHPYVGRALKRSEDPRLVRGEGQYVDDLRLPGLSHLAFLRSPHAHARIVALRVDAARNAPGVLAVVTAADLPPLR